MKARGVLLALLLGASCMPLARAQIALPALEGRVTDLTGTLTAAQQSSLEEKLAAFEARKGAQIAVLILPTTQPEDIAQFGVRLLESWKLGRKGLDDGAALIVAKDDHAARIEVQYGLEGVLTDATSGRIINDTILPLFKEGDFAAGVNAGVDQMIRVVDGEPLPPPDASWHRNADRGMPQGQAFPLLFFLAYGLVTVLGRFIGRGPATALGGAGTGAAAWWWTSDAGLAAVIAFGFVLLTLVFGQGSRFSRSGAGRVLRDIGGGFGGRSSGGGGGGWSGGGGSGGGGGASGRW